MKTKHIAVDIIRLNDLICSHYPEMQDIDESALIQFVNINYNNTSSKSVITVSYLPHYEVQP